MLVQADKIEIQLDALSWEMPTQKTFITQHGMFVKAVRPLAESAPIVVRLTIEGKTAEILADVRNCYEEIGMVIKFIDWPPRAQCQSVNWMISSDAIKVQRFSQRRERDRSDVHSSEQAWSESEDQIRQLCRDRKSKV